MLEKCKIKLFKMNDYEWVAAESKEQDNEWYEKVYGERNDIEDVIEEPPDKAFGDFVDEADQDELNQGFERKSYCNREIVKIPFSYMLSKMTDEIEEPWIVGSTEW